MGPRLVHSKVKGWPRLTKFFEMLEGNAHVQSLLRMANMMAVTRLFYNDHGLIHSRMVAGSALEMLDILERKGIQPSLVRDGEGDDEDSRVVVLGGAYLHDIGNSVHREQHHIHGVYLAENILRRLLLKLYADDKYKAIIVKQEILHAIFSHDESVVPLTIEAGVAKVADGTDMAEGRARIPYRLGKSDIHSFSALAIKRVEVKEGEERPIGIVVDMDNEAGIFQVEEILGAKIKTSGIAPLIEVQALKRGVKLKVWKTT
ncbi:MAG: HD domain-containing protein [Candidatus Nezhaarchaeota archaeon]|nr:HD domain-containing protein [Candidatus Nezhaarchaeota archaeon]MCX8142461.1 HD domain-containing protein [Candidatus Nezhaarchaeota archaeon]MDW8050566.1 HD domain-containing protein [Nitrososphaerota archaeon]